MVDYRRKCVAILVLMIFVGLKAHYNVWDNFWYLNKPFKNDKKFFLFHLKSYLFVLKIFKFLSWLFGHVKKTVRLEG